MTKKEFFQQNNPRAALCVSVFACYVLYGIEYGADEYAYITYETDNGLQAQHKLLIRYTTRGEAYVLLNGRHLKLKEFHRI